MATSPLPPRDNSDMTYFLLQQMSEQIREINDKVSKNNEQVNELKVEISKISNVKNDIETIEKSLKKDIEKLHVWREEIDQIVTKEDLKKIKEDSSNFKKFQVQIMTTGFIIMFAFQLLYPYIATAMKLMPK